MGRTMESMQAAAYRRAFGSLGFFGQVGAGAPDWAVSATGPEGQSYLRATDDQTAALVALAFAAYRTGEIDGDTDPAVGSGTYLRGSLDSNVSIEESLAMPVGGLAEGTSTKPPVGIAVIGDPLESQPSIVVLASRSLEQMAALAGRAKATGPFVVLKEPPGGWMSGYTGAAVQLASITDGIRLGSVIGGVLAIGGLVLYDRRRRGR